MIKNFGMVMLSVASILWACCNVNSENDLSLKDNKSIEVNKENIVSDVEVIQASKVLDDYLMNRDSSDRIYLDNEFVFSGYIWDVTKDKYRLLIDYINGKGFGVVCVAPRGKPFENITDMQIVKVKGKCIGIHGDKLYFSECVILEKSGRR